MTYFGLFGAPGTKHPSPTHKLPPRPPNVPLSRALWSLSDGLWGVLKESWGVRVCVISEINSRPSDYPLLNCNLLRALTKIMFLLVPSGYILE